jgi:hypothetical protein
MLLQPDIFEPISHNPNKIQRLIALLIDQQIPAINSGGCSYRFICNRIVKSIAPLSLKSPIALKLNCTQQQIPQFIRNIRWRIPK